MFFIILFKSICGYVIYIYVEESEILNFLEFLDINFKWLVIFEIL